MFFVVTLYPSRSRLLQLPKVQDFAKKTLKYNRSIPHTCPPPDDNLLQTRIKKSMMSIQLHDHLLCHSCSICRYDFCRLLYISCPVPPSPTIVSYSNVTRPKMQILDNANQYQWDLWCNEVKSKCTLQKHMGSIFFVKNSNLVVPFFHTGLFDVANAVILCILREK